MAVPVAVGDEVGVAVGEAVGVAVGIGDVVGLGEGGLPTHTVRSELMPLVGATSDSSGSLTAACDSPPPISVAVPVGERKMTLELDEFAFDEVHPVPQNRKYSTEFPS